MNIEYGYNFGPNKIYGIEFSLFNLDHLDMAVNVWELFGFKVLFKLMGFNIVLASIEIADTRASLCICNCHLTVFWG